MDVPDAELTELRRRIKATRLPEKEPVADMSQGIPLATVEKLALLGKRVRLAQVRSEIQRLPELHHRDRRPGHPLHSCSLEARERPPIIVTHGWPGSAVWHLKIIEPLTNPTAHGGRIGRIPCGDPVDAGLRILGKANLDRLGPRPHRTRLGGVDESSRLHALRGARRRLGRDHHGPDGGRPRRD